jgi:hypothetical protein
MIDVRKVRAMGNLLIKLETRSRSGSSRKLVLIYISYLLPGLFIPWLLIKQNSDPTGFEYAFLSYLLYSVTIIFTLINDLDNLVISKSEVEIFTVLPADDRLIVRAKMYMMMRYFTFLSIPLLIPGSLFYYFITFSFMRVFIYAVSGLLLILFLGFFITLIYTAALKLAKPKKLSSISLAFQLILIFVIIITYQLVSYGVSGRMGSGAGHYITLLAGKGLLNLFPQSWFALLPSKGNYAINLVLILKLILPLFLCQMAYLSLKWYMEATYPVIKERYIYARVVFETKENDRRFFLTGFFKDLIQYKYLRNSIERSSYGLLTSLYRKDKTVRMSILPMIIIPAGLTIFAAITNQLPYPFGADLMSSRPVFHISILICILVVLNTALLGIKITNYPGAAWIYDAYPVESQKAFRNGIRKFFVIRFLLPLFVLLFIIMAVKIPAHFTLIHIFYLFSAANLYNSIYNILTKALPFTRENSLINSLKRVTTMFFPVLFGIIMSLIMIFIYSSIEISLIAILVIITLTFWLNFFAFHYKIPKTI